MKRKYYPNSHGMSYHRTKYFSTRHSKETRPSSNQPRNAMSNETEESNLSKFWRECRERDIRKRRYKLSNQFVSNNHQFNTTIHQLKLDAQKLSHRFQRRNQKSNKNTPINPENRRHSMGPNAFADTNRRSNLQNQSTIHPNIEQSENCKIFFENKNYYSALHEKYNHSKSNIECIYDYIDSLRNDDTTFKTKIQQKWKELRKDVNKLNYFQKKKEANHEPSSKPIPPCSANTTHDEHKDKENEPHRIHTTLRPSEINQNKKKCETMDDQDHSSSYCLSNLQKSNEYWDYSVRQLKDKLLKMNVSVDECIEKRDLIQKIKVHRNHHINGNIKYHKKQTREHRKPQRVNASAATTCSNQHKPKPSILYETILSDTRESKQQIRNRVDLWIQRWSYRRSFRQLLNSVLGNKPTDKQYLSRGGKHDEQNYELVMKLYKKAILLIHPDKHVHSSFEVKYKSVEMFKVITAKCDKYRQRHNAHKW